MHRLESHIRDVPDFPKKGIIFKDITPLLRDAPALSEVIETLATHHAQDRVDAVAAVESRGFIFGCALALRLGAGFIPLRKPGKLPYRTIAESYALEYGTDSIEMHEDAVSEGDRVLVLDDLLATGGTAAAAVSLLRKQGADVVGASFVIELDFLDGRAKLDGLPVHSLLHYK